MTLFSIVYIHAHVYACMHAFIVFDFCLIPVLNLAKVL